MPETDGLVLQTYMNRKNIHCVTEMEQYGITKMRNWKYISYQYENGKMKYLFEEKMPQSNGLVANQKDVLFGVQSEVKRDTYRYNLKENKTRK